MTLSWNSQIVRARHVMISSRRRRLNEQKCRIAKRMMFVGLGFSPLKAQFKCYFLNVFNILYLRKKWKL